MPIEKITFEELQLAAAPNEQAYAQELHSYLLESGCKAAFEKKKTSLLGSYKFGKPPKSVLNVLLKKDGLYVRIYGEHIHLYTDFLQNMTTEMVTTLDKRGDCARLTHGGCSTKCKGYDFTIRESRYQKCRYNCFEFLVTEESGSYIMDFVKQELGERQKALTSKA